MEAHACCLMAVVLGEKVPPAVASASCQGMAMAAAILAAVAPTRQAAPLGRGFQAVEAAGRPAEAAPEERTLQVVAVPEQMVLLVAA
mmetsp:Transcript_37747/g.111728  ORF Transcript_37747/g.111728 Transcript_37747/m.111728 type:complete len:87 (-) Transcript_37747:398-658(-)